MVDLCAPGRPAGSLWLLEKRGPVQRNVDFAAQGQCFVDVALVASIWVLCALLGALAASIWRSWAILGRPWDALGRSWGALGCSWGSLGHSWDPRGVLWGRSWHSWVLLGALGGFWGSSWPLLGRFWAALGWLDWVQANASTTAPTTRIAKRTIWLSMSLPRLCLLHALWNAMQANESPNA